MPPPARCDVLFPDFEQPDQLFRDRPSGDLSRSAATDDRLERFGQIAGRKATWLIEVKDIPRMPLAEMLGSAIGLKLTGDVPSDARAWTNPSTHCLA
jgi:hypothetical protein